MYEPLREEITQAAELLESIRQLGTLRYLRQKDAMHKRLLTTRISRCRELEDRLTALITCVRSEMKLSDERYVAGELAADTLTRMGYTVTDRGFRIRDEQEQPLDAYDVEAELTEGAEIRITFSPVRQNGVAVRNECIITITLTRLPERSVYESLAGIWTGRVRQALQQGGVDPMAVTALQAGDGQQTACDPPSPETYAKRIAMKY
jgi:hypothetical protein